MSGNPYLDAYESQSEAQVPDAYAAYRSQRLSRRLARLKRLQERDAKQAKATEAQSTFGQAPAELTPVQKRMQAAQDAYESEIKKYGVAEGPTVQEFANTRDPRMVQMQLDREAEAKKQEAEFWKAVQAGDDGAINSALDAMAPAWDKLREQKAQIEAAKQHLASLDPTTHADEILRAKPVLEDAYAQLQKTEAHLTELGDRVNAGIGARTAGEMSAAAKMDTYGARFSKFSIPTLAAIGDFLGKGQRVVSAMLAIPKNLAQGQFHAKELKALVPGYNLFSTDVQGAGAQMNAEVGNALGQYVKEAEGDFTGQNALRGLYNPLGGALVGTSRLAAQAEEGYDIAKAKVSGEDYVPEMSGAERRTKWGDTLGGLGYQIVTDPLSYIPTGAASEVFGKLIKPIEPVLDAVSKRIGLKGAAKVVRALTVGGPALEDPLMAQYAANAKAAEMTAAAPFVEGAYEAQAKLEAKLAAIPPELRPVAQDVAPRALEGIPAAERGGFVETQRTLKGAEAATPEQLANLDKLKSDLETIKRDWVAAREEARAAQAGEAGGAGSVDATQRLLRANKRIKELEPVLAKAEAEVAAAERTILERAPSVKYNEILKDIPPQHRAVVMDYVQTLGDDAELLKAMTEGRLGRSIELSDNILEGYAARRYDPIFKQWLAANPQVQEALNELKVAQHYAAIGEKVPATNQFASRKFAEGTTFHDAEQLLKEKYGYTGDIWSRNQAEIAHGDWIFAGEAAKRQADMEEWGKVFAHEGAPSKGAVVKAEEFYKKMNAKIPEELKGKFFSASDIKDFEKMKAIESPAAWRKILNNVTNWFSRANLVTPTSLAKDFKGQTVQFGFAAGESGWKYLDKARRIVDGAEAPGIVSNLFASGLGKPSYHTAVNPSVGKVIADFGGGLKGRVAGAIEESGLTGGAIRGVGKAVGAVPGLGTVGRGIEGAGKLVGTGLRKALNARQLTEEYFRVATYLHAIEDLGKTPLEAVQHVAKWWGDFSQLSKLENRVLKGFTMYTSWQLRALKIGMHNLVDRPLRTRLFLQLAAGNVSNNEDFPGWAQRQGGTIIGKDSAGNPKFMSRGAGSYFEPIGDVLQGDAMQRLRTDGFAGALQGVAQSGLRRLVPFLQAPIEYATNYDSFSGSQIRLESGQDTRTRVTDHAPAAVLWLPEGLKKFFGVYPVKREDTGEVSYIHMDPEWNWLFQKLIPGVESQAGFVSPLADPRKNAFDFAARALGFPTYSVREQDIQSRMKTKIRQATDALRKSVGGTGVAVDDYGNVVFDKTSDLGRQMIEDNARWDSEAKQGRNPDGTPINADAYKRFKMANKYADALRLIDLGRYLRDWKAALENPGLPDAGVPVKDATSGLRKLGKDEARRDVAAERRALRGR